MKNYSSSRLYQNHWFLHPLTIAVVSVLCVFFLPSNIYAQCSDYCSKGYAQLNLNSSADSLCFTIPSGGNAWVCMELNMSFNPNVSGCLDTALVDVEIFKKGTEDYAAPDTCTSPLHYQFQANNPQNTGACPSGYAVQCCCLPPGDYYIKVLSWGANYAKCYTGYVKVCIECNAQRCN